MPTCCYQRAKLLAKRICEKVVFSSNTVNYYIYNTVVRISKHWDKEQFAYESENDEITSFSKICIRYGEKTCSSRFLQSIVVSVKLFVLYFSNLYISCSPNLYDRGTIVIYNTFIPIQKLNSKWFQRSYRLTVQKYIVFLKLKALMHGRTCAVLVEIITSYLHYHQPPTSVFDCFNLQYVKINFSNRN